MSTPHGPANVHLHPADRPKGALVLGHGAGGGVTARDLVATTGAARAESISVALVEQPYRVAGRRSPAPATQLDTAWTAVVDQLTGEQLRGLPLVVGGRSSGARVACRTAEATGAIGVLCLAFPLQPARRTGAAPAPSRLPELDAVTVPTLVVQGTRDPFGMPRPADDAPSCRSQATTGCRATCLRSPRQFAAGSPTWSSRPPRSRQADCYRRPMPTGQPAPHAPDRQHYAVTFALLAVAGISYALLQSLVAPALPEIQQALHTSENSVSWVLTAYLLSASIATPLIGRLGDMYGKERLLMIVLVLLAIGTLVSALSTTLAVMLVGRVIQGAAGGIFPLAFGIIRDEFPRERVAGGIGLMSALLGVGGGVGRRPLRADRRPPLVPLPLLAAADPDRDRNRVDPGLRARVAHPRPRPRELGRDGTDVGGPRRRADRRQRNGDLALALRKDDRPDRGRGRAALLLGQKRVADPTTRSSTCT